MIDWAAIGIRMAWRALAQHPARHVLLCVTVIVAVAAWLGLAALTAPFVGTARSVSGLGVQVLNARGSMGSMTSIPKRYAARIAALPSVRDARYSDALPVMCTATASATLNAVGGSAVGNLLDNDGVSSELARKWKADPLGVLVGSTLASQCGWHAGMTVSPRDPMLANGHVEIHITGVFRSPGGTNNQIAIAHYAYVNRVGSLAGRDHVLLVSAFPRNAHRGNAVAAQIEAMFATSDPPVVANTSATTQNALVAFGKIQDLLAVVMVATFLSALLVLASVMAHAAVERCRSMAVMQVLGFRRAQLFSAFVFEHVLVVIVGGGLGIGIGLAALRFIDKASSYGLAGFLLGGLQPPPWAWYGLPVWLTILLVLALIGPALTTARLRPVDYQQT
ncbi:MAG: FtsX-like permease family protein [Rhodanobacteraceae bacterium]